ncbi:MAG: tripartite tricarboxylate transporter substrate binding protein [Burkholderiales bacterium]|nr:tripartite tricarboxylate transporter substrate binding protein [Burkholderiales bacterium]
MRASNPLPRLLTGCLVAACACAAPAQSYPAKPIRVLIATSAGSNPDTLARIVAHGLTSALGQQVVVDNRAGAGGNIGAEIAARAPADGYTVFLAHTNHSINASLYRKLNYDLLTDFAPVSLMALSSFVAAVHPSLPVKSVPGLIRLAKARPGDIVYASAGTGSGTFFTAEYFSGLAGVKMLHVAYKGGGPALAAVVSGEAAVYFSPIATGLPHIRNGRLRALGVAMLKRAPELPDVPAIADTLPGFEMYSWAGLMVPVKTPKAIVDTLQRAAVAALKDPEAGNRLKELGFIAVGSTPEELTSHCRKEIDKYAKIIRSIGLPQQ